MNNQLNIMNVLDMLLRRWLIVLVSALLVGIFSFIISEVFIPPTYSSSASLYVISEREKTDDDISQSIINTSRQLVMTYVEILNGRTFLTNISRELDYKYSVSQLRSMIKMESLNDTEILSITVKGSNADDVYRIIKNVVAYAPDELIRVVEAGSVKILDDAIKTETPIAPNIRQNTFVGVFIGLVIGAFIAIFLELLDTRIKDGSELSMRYEEPLLGEIPSLTARTTSSSYGYARHKSERKG